jgi:hypothetical protein
MALDWKMLLNFIAIWNIFIDIWDILSLFGKFCVHFVHCSGFGIKYLQQSGNYGLRSNPTKAGASFMIER